MQRILCFTQKVQTLTHSCFCPHLAPIRQAPNSQRTPIMESFFPQSKFPEICSLITLSHTICPNCQRTLVSQSHSAPYHRIINQQMMLGDRSLTHHWQILWIFFSPHFSLLNTRLFLYSVPYSSVIVVIFPPKTS
jgi:hypothetical protein